MSNTVLKNDLTEGVIWKKLLSFFFPILLGTLFQQLYNTVDAIIVGNFVGTTALAAVGGSASNIINLIVGFFVGLSSGATVIIAQYFGAGDSENLSKTVHTAMAFCLIVGAALTVAGYFITPWALDIANVPLDTVEDATTYLRIYFTGTVPLMIFNIGSGILRAMGDSRRPLYYLIICCLANIALDILFVAVFGWGVAGVAWASVIALVISGVFIVVNLATTNIACRLYIRKIRIYGSAIKKILYIGVPAGLQSAMYSVSNFILQVAVNGLGTTVVAAWTTTGKLDGVYWAISNSFGMAISAFVGQAFGAGKFDRMKKSVRVCLGMSLGITVVMSVLLLTLGKYGFRLFTDDMAVVDYAVEMMTYFAPFYVVWTFIEIISNALRGAGDAMFPTVITGIGVCGLRILWCVFVVPVWNTVMGISVSYPFTWVVTALAYIIYYLRSDWLGRCIKAANMPKPGEALSEGAAAE